MSAPVELPLGALGVGLVGTGLLAFGGGIALDLLPPPTPWFGTDLAQGLCIGLGLAGLGAEAVGIVRWARARRRGPGD